MSSIGYMKFLLGVMTLQVGLFTLYLVLFALALWSLLRGKNTVSRVQVAVSVTIFFLELAYLVTSSIQNAALVGSQSNPKNNDWETYLTEEDIVDIMLPVTCCLTVLIQLLSDGLLAWRFYAVYERKRWALIVAVFILFCDLVLGALEGYASFQYSILYGNEISEVIPRIKRRVQDLTIANVAWPWGMFVTNTFFTAAILLQIIRKSVSGTFKFWRASFRHKVVVKAIIESALVSWIGLLLFAMFSGYWHYTTYRWGYTTYSMLAFLFGISQCLITIRLQLVRNVGKGAEPLHRHASLLGRKGAPVFMPTFECITTQGNSDVCVSCGQIATVTPFPMMSETNEARSRVTSESGRGDIDDNATVAVDGHWHEHAELLAHSNRPQSDV